MSEALILEALLTAKSQAYHDVYLCSTSFQNAKELLRRLSIWIEAFGRAGRDLGIAEHKKTEVVFSNGSRIIPMPALKVRSRTGTVILDELAFYQWDREVWKAIAPVADTDPNMRIMVVSTPWGASGMFWELWNDPEGQHGEWSRHKIDIYDAAEAGFPIEPDEIRQKYPSDVFAQEFGCQFLSDINQYFGYDLIRQAQYSPCDLEGGQLPDGQRYAGVDLASRQDASVMAEATEAAEAFWVGLVHTIKQAGEARDYTPQFGDIEEILAAGDFAGVGVDATGEGAQLGQDLYREFGQAVKLVKGQGWKEAKARIPNIRLAMEQGAFRIPNDPKVRHAFSQVQRTETTSNNVTFEAERDAEGHADEFFASLLAWDAAKSKPGGRKRKRNDKPTVGYQQSPF